MEATTIQIVCLFCSMLVAFIGAAGVWAKQAHEESEALRERQKEADIASSYSNFIAPQAIETTKITKIKRDIELYTQGRAKLRTDRESHIINGLTALLYEDEQKITQYGEKIAELNVQLDKLTPRKVSAPKTITVHGLEGVVEEIVLNAYSNSGVIKEEVGTWPELDKEV